MFLNNVLQYLTVQESITNIETILVSIFSSLAVIIAAIAALIKSGKSFSEIGKILIKYLFLKTEKDSKKHTKKKKHKTTSHEPHKEKSSTKKKS